MGTELNGISVAFVVSNEGIEEAELLRPWEHVQAEGGAPKLVAIEPGEVELMRHLDQAGRFPVDLVTRDARASDFDALVLPGGVANADRLRSDGPAVALVQEMFRAGRPAAVICHAPWVLVEADLVRGRTLTSWPSLRTDIVNAGGTWVDAEVQVCASGPNTLVTSRKPDDLDAFNAKLTDVLRAARGSAAA
jgi:protease I